MNRVAAEGKAVMVVARERAGYTVGRAYRVTRIGTEEELCALREPWAELTANAAYVPLCANWEWVTTWWKHRDCGTDLWVLVAWDEAGSLAGLVPWMLMKDAWGPLQLRRLTFLGRGIVYPVHMDAIARHGEERAVCEAFLAYLDASHKDWDVLDLGDLNYDSPFRACLHASHWPHHALAGDVACVSDLPASWEQYEREKLSSTRRKHLGQYRRKLEREHPNLVRFYEVVDSQELQWALDAMSALNRTRWHDKSVHSAFDDEHFVAFHHELAQIALVQGWLRFYVLRVGDEMVAAIYGFLRDQVFYCYQSAFNLDWGKYGPGQLVLGYGFEKAIEDGACDSGA